MKECPTKSGEENPVVVQVLFVLPYWAEKNCAVVDGV